jgi:hypothetical protein
MKGRRRGFVHRLSGAIGVLIVAATGSAFLLLLLGPAEAGAVITDPIPANVGPTPPPIPSLPAAGDATPPADVISDPIEPAAVCGSWYQQSAYGGAWPSNSTWWEYRCDYEYPQCRYACNANWVPDVYYDYFYWDPDRSQPVFYGEYLAAYYFASLGYGDGCEYWWDAPTSTWYRFESPLYGDMGLGYCAADTTPPDPPSTPDLDPASDTGSSDSDNVTADTTPTFTGSAEPGATVKIYVDGAEKGSAAAGSEGGYSVTTSQLDYGAKQKVTATAADAAGNTSGASGALSITISKRAR